MKRKNNNGEKPTKDSKALNQIAHLIDVRLPDQHGFCLLTFPLGAAIDPRIRYVGKGDREDIIKTLEFWCEQQRSGALGFGTHSDRPEPSQWHTRRPDEPGLYLLRYPADKPDHVHFVKLDVDATDNDRLMIADWDGDQWNDGFEYVDEISENHLWLGPIPQPWLNSQFVEIPEPEEKPDALDWKIGDGRPPTYVADGDSFTIAGTRYVFRNIALDPGEVTIGATPHETADNLNKAVGRTVAGVTIREGRQRLTISAFEPNPSDLLTPQFGEGVPPIESTAQESWFGRIETHHEFALTEAAERLLRGYPEEGAKIDRQTLKDMIATGFISGVSAQSLNPIKL